MNDKKKTDKFLRELNSIFEKEPGQINEDTLLRDDLNAASIHYFGIIGAIKELTNRDIPYSKVKACNNISELIALFEKLM